MPVNPPSPVRFGVFQVDLRSGELRKSGVRVRLQEQPFQILAMLLERPGDVVSREELRKKLWAEETFVDFDHGLNTAVQRLREALGDTAENPRFIETLPRRGYRFVAPVDVSPAASLQTSFVPAAPEPSVASAQETVSEARALDRTTGLETAVLKASRDRAVFWIIVAICAAAALSASAFLVGRRTANTPITIRQLTFRYGFPMQAMFGPDGHSIFYDALWDGKPAEIFTTNKEVRDSRSLGLRETGLFSISSTGEMAVAVRCQINYAACYGTLARVSSAGGVPREIAENVFSADWSPDGKALAVARVVEGKYRVEYPLGKVLYESSGWIGTVRVSPKGDLVAFDEHPRIPYPSGWVALVDTAGKKRILSSAAEVPAGLLWSRSGDEVWFGTNEGIVALTLSGRRRLVFHSLSGAMPLDMSRDGRDVLAIQLFPRAHICGVSGTSSERSDFSWFDSSATADISADGKTLLLYEWGGSGVYLRRTDGSDAVRLGDGRALALSPDGKWALAVQETSQLKLIMLPTGPGEQKILPLGNVSEIYWGAWFPDGRQIMFVGAEPGHLLRTYIHNLDSGNTSPVTAEGMVGILVSPDNKRIAAYGPDGNYYLVGTADQEPKAIPGALPGDTATRWSNDGSSIYFRAAADFEVKIYRVDLNTDRREFWRKLAPADPVGIIGIGSDPRGVLITPDGKSVVYTYWSASGELYLLEGLQ